MLHIAEYFPITDPTLIFFVVLLIILFAPIIMGKLRIPHIIGMVLAGVLVGKYGLNILERDSSFELFGKVGLYYIMFLAALEMDMEGMKKNKMRLLIYDLLTCFVPFFRLEPDANNNVSATIRVNSFKPYLGFGYGGRFFRDNDIYHISFDAGILFWGGTPRITTNDIHKVTFSPNEDYTEAIKNETIEPGVNLAKDVYNIPGKVGDYVKFFKGFKVYPVLELRLSRRICF